MEAIESVGILAMVIGLVRSIPQLHKIHTTGNVSSFSKESIYLGLLSLSLWFTYEFAKGQRINLISTILSILMDLWVLYKIYQSTYTKDD